MTDRTHFEKNERIKQMMGNIIIIVIIAQKMGYTLVRAAWAFPVKNIDNNLL